MTRTIPDRMVLSGQSFKKMRAGLQCRLAAVHKENNMQHVKIEVIIPVYRPDGSFPELVSRLQEQEMPPENIRIMNTQEEYWNKEWEKQFPILEVHHLTKKEFDHGGTRKQAAALSKADILVFMTQDAMPADKKLLGNLIRPLLEEEKAGASYARQLPKDDCRFLERYTRSFNYPDSSCIRREKDVKTYGIKTYFCSNVCAAYRRDVYEKVGGFPGRAIFNEDMIYAGNMTKAGYGIAYAADAQVFHSHNYSCMQQLHRNFDLGVSQAEHPEIFADIPSEGEGIRLVKKSFVYLCQTGHIWLIPQLILQSGFKYVGYFLGKRYQKLPGWMIQALTMSPDYWKKK